MSINRLSYIKTTTNKDRTRYYNSIKYPKIPLSISDIYVITTEGDRLDKIANQFYKDSDLWWIISKANPNKISRDSFFIKSGLQIRIPTNINDVYSNGEVTETSAYLAACDIK